jgi:hypothetical protein
MVEATERRLSVYSTADLSQTSGDSKDTAEQQRPFPDHPSGKIWSIYLSEIEKHDKALTRGWKDEMDGILIFVSASMFTVS